MGHKLHDVGGWLLVSADWHMGVHWPTPIPAVMPFWELNAAHPFTMAPGVGSVFFNGKNAVQDSHEPKFLWIHFPVVPDPLNLLIPLDILFGSQQCWIPRLGVLVEGTPANVTILPCEISFNLVCHSFGKIPTSVVLQPGTVETTPTAADFGAGLIRAAVNLAIDVVFFFATGGHKVTGSAGRVGWQGLRQNFRQFFTGRYLTTARNRFAREFMSRVFPSPDLGALNIVQNLIGAAKPGDLAAGTGGPTGDSFGTDFVDGMFKPPSFGIVEDATGAIQQTWSTYGPG